MYNFWLAVYCVIDWYAKMAFCIFDSTNMWLLLNCDLASLITIVKPEYANL